MTDFLMSDNVPTFQLFNVIHAYMYQHYNCGKPSPGDTDMVTLRRPKKVNFKDDVRVI